MSEIFKPLRGLLQVCTSKAFDGRSVASNNLSGGESQIHFTFEIDKTSFSRVVFLN